MAIIIEGMDNSGKSTLGEALAATFDRIVQESEGPPLIEPALDPTGEIEINERVDRYEAMTDRVFVRHPVISNSIYGQVRDGGDPITEGRRMIFYEAKHVFIYCDAGTRGLDAHILKAHDTNKHIDDVTRNYERLLELYRIWAMKHAHFVYRIGDDMDKLIATAYFFEQYDLA